MAQPPPDLLGRLAVHYKLISMPQLAAATREQTRAPAKKLGTIMVELGFINETQLNQLVEAQRQYLAQQAEHAPKVLKQAQAQQAAHVQPAPQPIAPERTTQARPKPPLPQREAGGPSPQR